jgi:hypothetical protein
MKGEKIEVTVPDGYRLKQERQIFNKIVPSVNSLEIQYLALPFPQSGFQSPLKSASC